jgi:K(+)-stimulated pyrophosphate-energized sodium pump
LDFCALAGFYGALAASAMMATTAMQLAIDALDLSDNAGGIAEMSELPKCIRTDILDSVGNDCSNWKRFCYRFSSVNFIGIIAAYVTLLELTESIF